MIYIELFLSYLQIGLFSIGGGYAAIPLIEQQAVDIHQWLTMEQFADIVAIAEMTPGPIAINSATFVGMMTAGFPGALVATAGCVFPSFVIVLILACLYSRYRSMGAVQGILSGLRPAVIALIASAGISLFLTAVSGASSLPDDLSQVDIPSVAIFLAALFVLRRCKADPIKALAGTGAAGLVLCFLL